MTDRPNKVTLDKAKSTAPKDKASKSKSRKGQGPENNPPVDLLSEIARQEALFLADALSIGAVMAGLAELPDEDEVEEGYDNMPI